MFYLKHIILFNISIFLLCSCSPLKITDTDPRLKHVISIDRDGNLRSIVSDPENTGSSHPAKPESYKNIFDGIRAFKNDPINPRKEVELVIYIHGGLNSDKSALRRARKHSRLIIKDNKYPIFVNWESGPFKTYGAHLSRVRHGKTPGTAPYTAPIYLLTDIATSIVTAPKSWLVMGEHSVRSTLARTFGKKDEQYLDSFKDSNQPVLANSEHTPKIRYVGNGKCETLRRKAQWLITSPLKVVTTPFTYTMGKPAWDIMLRRTNTLFYRPQDYLEPKDYPDGNPHGSIKFSSRDASGALSVFLRSLQNEINGSNGQKKLPVKITLIGHSLGAIVVDKILSTSPELPVTTIVHMASADSLRNLFHIVIPYLNSKNKNKPAKDQVNFYSLSLHPENEDREVSLKGATPSGSLLVWIDNMFTTPETVLDKRSGRWDNVVQIIPTLSKDAGQHMHFKIFGLQASKGGCENTDSDGLQSQPLIHGDFDNIKYWSKSIWWKG